MTFPAEVVEELVVDEMIAAAAHGESAACLDRWVRAWTICAGAYKRERRFDDAKRCEDQVVMLRALCRGAS